MGHGSCGIVVSQALSDKEGGNPEVKLWKGRLGKNRVYYRDIEKTLEGYEHSDKHRLAPKSQ